MNELALSVQGAELVAMSERKSFLKRQLPRTGAGCLMKEWVFFSRSKMTLVRDAMIGILHWVRHCPRY